MMEDPWYGTRGPRDSRIMVVGESWGSEEDARKLPFVGASGKELDRILSDAGIDPATCFFTNVIPSKPAGNDVSLFFEAPAGNGRKATYTSPELWGLHPLPIARAGIANLRAQVERVAPRVIIALGNVALWALTGRGSIRKTPTYEGGRSVPGGITDWRGSMLRARVEFGSVPVLPTLHPAYVMRNWADRIYAVHDLQVRVPKALAEAWDGPLVQKIATPSFDEARLYLEAIIEWEEPRALVCDIETRARNITCVGFSTSGTHALCLPLVRVEADGGLGSWWTPREEFILLGLLRRVLTSPNSLLVGQNFLYDMSYLGTWLGIGARFRCHFDTMVAHHILFPGTPKSLDVLSSLYREYHSFWKHESQGWQEIDKIEQLFFYNCEDCVATYEVYEVLQILVARSGLTEQFDFKMKEYHTLWRMMVRGLRTNEQRRSELQMETLGKLDERYALLERVIPQSSVSTSGKSKWYTSPHQQKQLFYDEMGLPPIRDRKTGAATFNEEAILELKRRVPILTRVWDTLLEIRSLGVFSSNYLSASCDPDGRMRTSFNPTGAETMRLSSSKNPFGRGGNFQNISSGDED